MYKLDDIVERLNRQRQRATYGAVAELVGKNPRSLVQGVARSPRYSWIVTKATGLPTNYKEAEKHPELKSRPQVISDGQALKRWLDEQP